MHRLIWIFAVRSCPTVRFLMLRPASKNAKMASFIFQETIKIQDYILWNEHNPTSVCTCAVERDMRVTLWINFRRSKNAQVKSVDTDSWNEEQVKEWKSESRIDLYFSHDSSIVCLAPLSGSQVSKIPDRAQRTQGKTQTCTMMKYGDTFTAPFMTLYPCHAE